MKPKDPIVTSKNPQNAKVSDSPSQETQKLGLEIQGETIQTKDQGKTETKLSSYQNISSIPDPEPFIETPPAPTPPTLPEPPKPQSEQPLAKPVETVSTISTVKKGKGFKIFLLLTLFITFTIYSFVFYLYLQNKKLKGITPQPQKVTQEKVSPTPGFSPDQIIILNGNIVRQKPGEEPFILVNKEDYESTGIAGFSKVVVSPDNTRICFESIPPALEPALYIAKIDGSDVNEVSPNRQGCTWSTDSKRIYYQNSTSEKGETDIYFYDLDEGIEKNITSEFSSPGEIRNYQIIGLSADQTKIMCSYQILNADQLEESTSGQCEINLETNEITFL